MQGAVIEFPKDRLIPVRGVSLCRGQLIEGRTRWPHRELVCHEGQVYELNITPQRTSYRIVENPTLDQIRTAQSADCISDQMIALAERIGD